MRKTDYHQLAVLVPVENRIDEVVEVLDRGAAVVLRAPERNGMTLNPITVVDQVLGEYRSYLSTEFRAVIPAARPSRRPSRRPASWPRSPSSRRIDRSRADGVGAIWVWMRRWRG